jgi:hypothetical protein
MFTHLQDRKYYEERYDKFTVEWARRNVKYYENFYDKFEKKLPKGEKLDKPGNVFLLNVFYMETVGNFLCRRYEEREQDINDSMGKDEAKDQQIADARLTEEPYCRHCKKQGLKIMDKSLMHRAEKHEYDDPQEVMLMLQCPHCDKNSALWQDGTPWKIKPDLCAKCKTEVERKSTTTMKAINFTCTCPSCGYSYKEKLDLTIKKEVPDPDFAKDRIHLGLHDKEFRQQLFSMRRDFKAMAELGKEFKEKEDNKEVYDAIKELKKPKIAELTPLLSLALEKAGYSEFHLDQPEMGRDVFIGFNCLDTKTHRIDYDSRNVLKRLVNKTLENTNWRLTSDGISYRLGYLNGRLHAYEKEEDLKKLVEKSVKNKGVKRREFKADKDAGQYLLDKDGRKIIL